MMQKGYFFCGDIMGFSKLIEDLDGLHLEEKINDWIELVHQAANICNLTKVELVSDTVFAAVENDKSELNKLINFSRILLNEGISKILPVRGAISNGYYNWNKLIYGKAVIAAHQLEKNQQWIGVTLHSEISLSNEENMKFGLVSYPVPMLENFPKIYHSVVWNVPLYNQLYRLLSSSNLVFDKRCDEKIKNTAIFGIHLRNMAKKSLLKKPA